MKPLEEVICVGEYTLTHELGRENRATVYKGNDEQGHEVCVKRASLKLMGDWKAQELFQREASVLEQLSNPGHPGVPKFIDLMEHDDDHYLVLEYIDGKNLQDLVAEEGCLTPRESLQVALQALDILQYLHSHDIVHQDVKPSNLVLGEDGQLRLMDYSTVRRGLVYPAEGYSTIVESYDGYTPPDYFNEKLDAKNDVYSLGMTLFYVLSGLRPLDALTKKGRIDFGKLKAPWALRRVIERMTEPDFEDRLDVEEAAKRLLKMSGGQRYDF